MLLTSKRTNEGLTGSLLFSNNFEEVGPSGVSLVFPKNPVPSLFVEFQYGHCPFVFTFN